MSESEDERFKLRRFSEDLSHLDASSRGVSSHHDAVGVVGGCGGGNLTPGREVDDDDHAPLSGTGTDGGGSAAGSAGHAVAVPGKGRVKEKGKRKASGKDTDTATEKTERQARRAGKAGGKQGRGKGKAKGKAKAAASVDVEVPGASGEEAFEVPEASGEEADDVPEASREVDVEVPSDEEVPEAAAAEAVDGGAGAGKGHAKPMVKADAKPKGKAGAKPKAKAGKKAMATATEQEQESSGGQGAVPDGGEPSSAAVVDDVLRNRVKAAKFKKLYTILPDWVKTEFEEVRLVNDSGRLVSIVSCVSYVDMHSAGVHGKFFSRRMVTHSLCLRTRTCEVFSGLQSGGYLP